MTEQILEAERSEHLEWDKHAPDGNNSGNRRNGKTAKTVRSGFGKVSLETPRDRNGIFRPLLRNVKMTLVIPTASTSTASVKSSRERHLVNK
jgi:transposase-like protein